MASFFDDFNEKKKKKKTTVQTVTPTKAVKTTKETKQATKTKTVSQSSKALGNKSFVKGYENRKKVSLPTVTKPSLPKQTMNGSLRTPIRAMGETKKRAAQNTAVETRRRNQQTLSAADKKLSPVQQRAVQTYKADWDAAEARGDRAAMNLAHQRAEDIRWQQGYSGGVAGNEYISPKISRQDRDLLNQSGQLAMKQAKLDYDRASATGNTMAMKEAILEMTALRKEEKYRNMGFRPYDGMDAHGRTREGGAMTRSDMAAAEKRFQEGLYSTMATVPGSILSFFETTDQAIDNNTVERNRAYLQDKANRLTEYQTKLDMVRSGQGLPEWGSESWLEQQVRIAQNAKNLLGQQTIVDPNLPGQTLMRKASQAGTAALEGLEGVDRDLAQALMSVGQNLPSAALSAIPGVGPAIGAGLMGLQASGARAWELNEQTAMANHLARVQGGDPRDYGAVTPAEASFRGLLSGLVEAGTEKIGLDRLGKLLTGQGGRNVVKNILAQMGIEGTEESIAYTANYVLDEIAKDPNAEWTPGELWDSFRLGAIAGGMMAGPAQLIGNARNPQPQTENARRAFNNESGAFGLVRDDYTSRQDQNAMDEIDEISKRLGLTVQFADQVAGGAANASIRGNVVTIERSNRNPVRFLYGHEVAHYMQEVSPDAYTNFRAVIANEKEVSDRVEEIMAEGVLNWDKALDEVTADYAGTLIENERILQRFIQENQKNKPLLQRLADAFRGLLQKIKGKDKDKVQNAVEALELALEETVKGNRLRTGREARIETRRAKQSQRWQENRREDLIQRIIQDYPTMEGAMKAQVDNLGIEGVVDAYLNGGKNPMLAAYEEAQTRYSFKRAGDTRQAEEMEAQGADRETIWQATGQTRDAKDNWVEEVDDSKAKFYPQGDAKRQGNPDWVRLKELEGKMLDGSITQEELAEANALAQNLRGMPKGSTLGDYLDHPELFQAVPGIENTPFRMEDIEGKGERSARGIAVNRDLPQDQRLSTTLHETQHELQNREGRPTGATAEYWRSRGAEDAKAMYQNTAGEIEARETQKRMNMTAEERRETMPDLGWDEAVFAEDGIELSAEEKTAIHNELLEKVDNNAQAMEEKGVLAELTGQEFTKGEQSLLQQVAEFFEQQGSEVEREGFGTVRLNKRGIKDSMAHGLGRKKAAAFAAVPEVIKNGVQIDYQPNWKGRSYDTYVIAGEVMIDGEPNTMGVVLIKRAEDSRYYLHEVMAKEKGAPASFQTGATAEAARLPGDAESPSDTSIPQTEGESNEKLSDKALSSYERAYEMVYKRPLEKPKTVQQAAEQASVGVIDRLQTVKEPEQPKPKAAPLPTVQKKSEEEPPITAEDLAYMDELVDAAEDSILAEAKEYEDAERIIPGGKTDRMTPGEVAKEAVGTAYRKLVDSGDEIRKAGKQSGDKFLYAYYNQAKASTAAAQNMITMRQSDVNGKEVGESLVSIFGPIKKNGPEYFKAFEAYLYHRHNIDRMGTELDLEMLHQANRFLKEFDRTHPNIASMSRGELEAAALEGNEEAAQKLEMLEERSRWKSIVKPVFSYEMTARKSQGRVHQLEKQHPEFKELAERVYTYSRNLMQYRVDSGLITKQTMEELQKRYPHYVPTFRKQDGVSTTPKGKGTIVGKTVKRAEGGTGELIDIDKALAQQTMNVVRESAKNRFGQRLLSDRISGDYILDVQDVAQERKKHDLEDKAFTNDVSDQENTFTVYKEGKAFAITMTPAMYDAVQSLSKTGEAGNMLTKIGIGANNIYKKAITSWNPIFTVKNFLKDMQDSLLYTTASPAEFIDSYIDAVVEIKKGGENWKLYQALGGTASSVYNMDKSVELPKDSAWAKLVGKIQYANLAVEQAPRLAEFIATANKGNRTQEELMEAMYKAADITTNFGRSGDWGKMINRTLVPFFNPSIQGVDKLMRAFRDNPKKVGPWVSLIGRVAVLGIAPAIINAALFGDEEDYEELNQRDKDNNFMLPANLLNKEWDGFWIRVPRGRVLAAVGAMTNAGMDLAKGKEVNAGELIDTVWTNVGVINPLSGNIMKALMDTDLLDKDSPGKTWYGSEIESQSMQNKKPSERYDEDTSFIAKGLGKVTGLSPAKLDYLMDSYSGVFGDFILPLTTPTKATGRDPIKTAFVTDSTTSNRLSGDFYDLGDQLKYAEQDGSTTDTIAYDYWSKVSQDLSDVNEEIRKMENDLSLDSKAKRKKYRDLKAQANEIIREGMANVDAFRKAAEPYADQINEDTEWDIFNKVTREVLGAEKALEYDGKTTYEKAQEVVKEGGSYDSYYDYLQMERALLKVLDADSNLAKANERGITGDTLAEAQTISDQLNGEYQDLMEKSLTGSNGWKPSETDRKLSVLESLELPEEEAFAIWKMKILDDEARWDLKLLDEGGLPEMEYFRYKMAVKHMNGYEDPNDPGTTKRNSKKDMRLPVINSLDLTAKQKDILYLEEWQPSGLHEAPWH